MSCETLITFRSCGAVETEVTFACTILTHAVSVTLTVRTTVYPRPAEVTVTEILSTIFHTFTVRTYVVTTEMV